MVIGGWEGATFVKAVAIDPAERRILVEDVDPTPGELMRLCAAPRCVVAVATLPNGG
jgi:hypothetical protein